jgi:protein SCO1/2
MRGRSRSVAAALLGGTVLVLAGCTSTSASDKPSASASELNDQGNSTYRGAGLTPPQPRPQFTLRDTSGRQFKFGSQTASKPTLLYFGYTNCPDVCPTTLADIANGLREVPAKLRSQTEVVFVTTDVKRDSPAVLKAYLAKFDTGLPNKFIGLSGTQEQVDAAQAAAHVTLAEDDGQQHSAEVLLYGSDDYARVAFLQSNNEADQVAHDLPLVAGNE